MHQQLAKALRAQNSARLAGSVLIGAAIAFSTTALAQQAGQATSASNTESRQVDFNISAQPLGSAVIAFAEQAGVQVFFDSSKLTGLQSRELKGRHSPQQGLGLLLSGLPVSYSFSGESRVSVERVAEGGGQLELDATNIDSRALSEREETYLAPSSVAVITREQIERRNIRHTADMLEETAGVYSPVDQTDPGLSVNIRGIQDYGRINMNVDGMRQTFNVLGYQNSNGSMYVDPEFISSIDIKKSNSSGQGGAGAYGGIASFETISAVDILKDDQDVGGRVRASHGVGGEGNGVHFIGSGALAFRNDIWDGLLAYSERHLGNYYGGDHLGQLNSSIRDDPRMPAYFAAKVKYSENTQRSQLAKFGLNLSDDQRVQLSFIRTAVGTPEGSTSQNYYTSEITYRDTGEDDVETMSWALDYSYSPASNNWLDLKAKLYYVDTTLDRSTYYDPTYSSTPAYQAHYRTKTYGVQLDNTSHFDLSEWGALSFNHGFDFYQDELTPKIDSSQSVTTTISLPWPSGANGTPTGKRWLASLYGQLDYEYGGWLTAHAGLRYDHSRLFGKTGYQTTCLVANVLPAQTSCSFLQDVDDQDGAFSPTLGIAIKPGLDWLQLFANAGKGWRPAGVTEAFSTGRPFGGNSGRFFFPNPYLEAERSRNFELGFNIFKESLFFSGDRLGLKVAHFDNKIDNYIYMRTSVAPYGSTSPRLQNMAYVNNAKDTQFRGNEYTLDYSVSNIYLQASYTKMMADNDFCSVNRLGGYYQQGADEYFGGGLFPQRLYGSIIDVAQPADCSDTIWGASALIPADRGSLTLGSRWLDDRIDIGMRVRYSPDQAFGEPTRYINGTVGTGYKLYDLYGFWQLDDNLRLNFTVDNVLDDAYVVAGAALMGMTVSRGRTVVAGFEYNF